jgi:hypothetical protein
MNLLFPNNLLYQKRRVPETSQAFLIRGVRIVKVADELGALYEDELPFILGKQVLSVPSVIGYFLFESHS